MSNSVKVSFDATSKELWCVMKNYKWSTLSIQGFDLSLKQLGSVGFIPIFDNREQAVAWDDGSDEHVFRLTTQQN